MKKPILTTLILLIILSLGLTTILFLNNKQNTIPIIPKPKNNNSINIVFTTDKEYSSYLKVALKSLILNKDKDSIYNIYILSIDLNKKTQEELKTFKQNDVEIKAVPLKLSMLKGKIRHRTFCHHVSNADYFKFFIPEMFQNFDKILYLDSDILVLGDLSSLYNTDIQDKYIAVLRRYSYPVDLKEVRYNIGIILFNIQNCIKSNLTSKLLYTKNHNNDNNSITQATFNKAIPQNMAEPISPIYNNRTITTKEDFIKYNFRKNYHPFLDEINNLDELDKKTIIVHFAGYQKPWYNPKMKFAKQWWRYAHLVNPDWKVEKRKLFDRIVNSYRISKNTNKDAKTRLKIFFGSLFKKNYK